MPKKMTQKEAKAMEGTEFIHRYSDGDEIKSYVKKYDMRIGLTCFSLETKSKGGYKSNQREDDGTWCVVGCKHGKGSRKVKKALSLRVLTMIRDTGVLDVNVVAGGSYGGNVSCGFSS